MKWSTGCNLFRASWRYLWLQFTIEHTKGIIHIMNIAVGSSSPSKQCLPVKLHKNVYCSRTQRANHWNSINLMYIKLSKLNSMEMVTNLSSIKTVSGIRGGERLIWYRASAQNAYISWSRTKVNKLLISDEHKFAIRIKWMILHITGKRKQIFNTIFHERI